MAGDDDLCFFRGLFDAAEDNRLICQEFSNYHRPLSDFFSRRSVSSGILKDQLLQIHSFMLGDLQAAFLTHASCY